nr:MAG TPA: Head Tail Connector Protein [Caudoviricetes sp.]
MAYADYEFYKTSFFGNVVPESDFIRFSERASDFIDHLTFDRLADGLPSDERQQKRIKKAVCTLADQMYQIDIAEKNAIAAACVTSSSDVSGGGTTTGVIISRSAGSESISYATPQQIGASAKEWSAVYSVAGDTQKTNDLLLKTALPLLMGVRTDEGIPILYAGM